jgi:hypothetical protein
MLREACSNMHPIAWPHYQLLAGRSVTDTFHYKGKCFAQHAEEYVGQEEDDAIEVGEKRLK